MKPMNLGDPDVKLWVFTRSDMSAIGDAVLDALTEDPDLAPQKFGLWSPYKAGLVQAKSLWRGEAAKPVGFLFGNRRRPFEVGFMAEFGIVLPKSPFHTISWDSHPIVLRKVAIGRIERLFHRLIAASDPYLAVGFYRDDFERQNVYRNFRCQDGSTELYRVVGVHPDRFLPGLYWLNYFGPELTDSIPALARGACGAVPHGKGTLLKLADDPRQMATPESIERIEQCKRELGEHRFFVKNPELEEDGEAIELNLTGAPLPTRRSGDGSK
jgi:hypothetical protein